VDRIVIAGLRELGVHGVLAEEQTRPQPFEVDVELSLDATAAGESDGLDDTVVPRLIAMGADRDRVDALTAFADLIPHFVEQDRAAKLPTLPDGTTLDLTDPASLEKLKQAFMAMSPEQRVQAAAGFQEEALRFISGAFGKEMSPEMVERMRERLAQEMSASEPKAPPSEGGNV